MSNREHKTFQTVNLRHRRKKMWSFLVLYGKLPVPFSHCMTVFVRTDRNILGWWADRSRWSLLKPQRLKSWSLNAANSLPLANTYFQFWQCLVLERDRLIDSLVSSVKQTLGSGFILCRGHSLHYALRRYWGEKYFCLSQASALLSPSTKN